MKMMYLIMCLVLFAGCCSCENRLIEKTEDDVIAQRLTLEWKHMIEAELDGQKGDILELARYVRQTVHLHEWLLDKRDQARPEHKAIYQSVLDRLETNE